MAKRREALLREIRSTVGRQLGAEVEYGLKEFIQGLLVGFIIGFLIATQVL